MAAHTLEQRAFIIRRLAFYCPVPIIIADFQRQWKDTACDDAAVAACDPAKVLLGPDESVAFAAARQEANGEPPPLADKNARLHLLQWLCDFYTSSGRLGDAAKITVLIADEVGSGKGDDPNDGQLAAPIGTITRTVVYAKPPEAANAGGPQSQH